MSRTSRSELASLVASLCACSVCGQELSVEALRTELLEPIEISVWTIQSERLAQLSESQRVGLLRARAVLGEFFKSIDRIDSDPRQFVTDEYGRRMGDAESMRQAFVAYETTVQQIRVTDFSLLNESALELSFYVMVFAEGTYVVG